MARSVEIKNSISLKHSLKIYLSFEVYAFLLTLNLDFLYDLDGSINQAKLALFIFVLPLVILLVWINHFRDSWHISSIGIAVPLKSYWFIAVIFAVLATCIKYIYVWFNFIAIAGTSDTVIVQDFWLYFVETMIPNETSLSLANLTYIFMIKSLIGPLYEELLYRGVLQHGLYNTKLKAPVIFLIVSALWGAGHWAQGWDWALMAFLEGLFLSWLVYKSNSLLPALLVHCLGNFLWEASGLLIYARFT